MRSIAKRADLILLIAIMGVLCAGCAFVGGLHDGWSIRAENTSVGIDFVLRLTNRGGTSFLVAPSGSAGIMGGERSIADPGATVAVLDPVTCRIVSMVDLPPGHSQLTVSIEGTPQVWEYDLSEDEDPLAGAFLPNTDTCADSNPGATPKPRPKMVAGEWLNGWEMACLAPSSVGETFVVRGEFLDGAIEGCVAHTGLFGQQSVEKPNEPSIWNPDGDLGRLAVSWSDNSCATGATVSLYPTLEGYRTSVISISSACDQTQTRYGVEFFLTEPLDARLVHGDIDRLKD